MIKTRFQAWCDDPNGARDDDGEIRSVWLVMVRELPVFFADNIAVEAGDLACRVEELNYCPATGELTVTFDPRFKTSPRLTHEWLCNLVVDGWTVFIEGSDEWVPDLAAIASREKEWLDNMRKDFGRT